MVRCDWMRVAPTFTNGRSWRVRHSHGSVVRSGFTQLELLAAIVVIGILAAILLPTLTSAREASRRIQCVNHLQQIGVALGAYETQSGRYPPGAMHKIELLPFLDQKALVDEARRIGPEAAREMLSGQVIPVFQCPSDSPEAIAGRGYANYAGCFGSGSLTGEQNGMFVVSLEERNGTRLGEGILLSKVVDGLSSTVAMAEFLHGRTVDGKGSSDRLRTIWEMPRTFLPTDELDEFANYCDSLPPRPTDYGWIGSAFRGLPWHEDDRRRGLYNHVLPPNRPSCTNGTHVPTGAYTATSLHGGGVNVLFADGHVTFVSAGHC